MSGAVRKEVAAADTVGAAFADSAYLLVGFHAASSYPLARYPSSNLLPPQAPRRWFLVGLHTRPSSDLPSDSL